VEVLVGKELIKYVHVDRYKSNKSRAKNGETQYELYTKRLSGQDATKTMRQHNLIIITYRFTVTA